MPLSRATTSSSGDLRPVCQNQNPLQFPELLQPAGGGQVGPALFPRVRLKPGDGELRLLVHMLQQHHLPPIQLCPDILGQLHAPLRPPGGLRKGGPVAAQSGEWAENRGPVADGHPGVPPGGGMREVYDVVVWPTHA